MTEVSLGGAQGRPRLGRINVEKVVFGNRGMMVEAEWMGRTGEPWCLCR